jgi:hypothetical protein
MGITQEQQAHVRVNYDRPPILPGLGETRMNVHFSQGPKSRTKPKPGDIFAVVLEPDHRVVFGRVICTDAHASAFREGWSGANLIYLFRPVSDSRVPPRTLSVDNLLCPPILTSNEGWSHGAFETVGNREFEAGERLGLHCFEIAVFNPPRYFDERGNQLPRRLDPCGQLGITTLRGIERLVGNALMNIDPRT